MEFKIESKLLKKLLKTIKGVIKSNNFKVNVKAYKGGLTLYSAADNVEILIENLDAVIITEGIVSVHYSILECLSKNKDNNYIEAVCDGTNLKMKSGNIELNVPYEGCSDTYIHDDLCDTTNINIEGTIFKNIIKGTEFSTFKNHEREAVEGILFEFKDDSVDIVSIDKYRLSIRTINVQNNKKGSYIFRKNIISNIAKIVWKKEINIKLSENTAIIKFDNITIKTILIKGPFVNYQSILFPDDRYETSIKVNKDLFLTSINEIVGEIKSKKLRNYIELTLDDSIVISQISNSSTINRECKCEKLFGKEVTLIFNPKNLIEVLRVINCENIIISSISPISPILITDAEGSNNFKYNVMCERLWLIDI